jgi:hypothetical protein
MASVKTCFKCLSSKPLADFYRHAQMGDGHLNKCKECTKRDVHQHRAGNLDMLREYDRRRASLPHRVALRARVVSEWKAAHPERRAAHVALGNAVRAGRIARLPCLVCGERAEAHHPDYSRPLDVVWLCPAHHAQTHALTKKETA